MAGGESWPEKALLPGGVRGEAAVPEAVGGGGLLPPPRGDYPDPGGKGNDLRRSLNNGSRVVFPLGFTTHPLPLQKLPTSHFLPAALSLFLFPPVRVLRYLHFSSVFKIFHSKWALVKGNGRSDARSNAASKNPAVTFILHHGNTLVQICIAQL